MSLVAKFIFLHERVYPVWFKLVNLLVPHHGLLPDGFLVELVGDKDFLRVVEDEVERAQVLDLLVQIGDAVRINGVALEPQMRVQIVARSQHEFDSLILFILFVAIEKHILRPVKAEHAPLLT